MKEQFVAYIKDLQNTITSKIEAIDGGAALNKIFGSGPRAAEDALGLLKTEMYLKKAA